MRVISGSARGTRLETLPGEDVTRPTIDRVKEGMFSALQFLLPGARVLDLFAGSGQLGIEALSRGAARCVFVDSSRPAVEVIRRNCRAAGLEDQAQVVWSEAETFLARTRDTFHLALLDPPYRHGTLAAVLPRLAGHIEPNGTVLCESELAADLPDEAEGLVKIKQYRYGTVLVTRYQKRSVDL